MPVRDTSPYLHQCIQSIIEQTFHDWELIVVNDASVDSSLEILQDFSAVENRIKVINNPNPGLLNALRLGYKHTTGSHIHRMDSDDKMPKDKLSKMYEAWRQYGKGTVVTGGTEYFSDDGEVGDGFRRYDTWLCEVARNNSHKENIFRECVIPSNCWLVHRNDFDRIKGFEPSILPEDYDLCFRFYAGDLKIIGLETVLHHWRDRPDRISRNREEYKDNRFFELKIKYFFQLERDQSRPIVLWGAGKNGKDLAKLIQQRTQQFHWVCDNKKKIGKEIYGVKMNHFDTIDVLQSPQIIIAVASPEGQQEIAEYLNSRNKISGEDYWFFS